MKNRKLSGIQFFIEYYILIDGKYIRKPEAYKLPFLFNAMDRSSQWKDRVSSDWEEAYDFNKGLFPDSLDHELENNVVLPKTLQESVYHYKKILTDQVITVEKRQFKIKRSVTQSIVKYSI